MLLHALLAFAAPAAVIGARSLTRLHTPKHGDTLRVRVVDDRRVPVKSASGVVVVGDDHLLVVDDDNGVFAVHGDHPHLLWGKAASKPMGDLEAIIVATGTPPKLSPTVACMVQNALAIDDGPADVAAHDVSAACSGYLYALQGAHDMLQQRRDGAVLVVTAEAMTRYVSKDDFDTVVVFGDAVTATVVHGPERAEGSPILLHRPVLSASGDDGTVIHHGPEFDDFLFMDGPRVYTRAVREMLRMLDRAAAASGMSVADLMHVVPHQANGRIISSIQARSGLPADRFVVNVERWGNTSSSTIPIALAEHLPSGPTGLGGLVAFGAGLTSGAAIVEFPQQP